MNGWMDGRVTNWALFMLCMRDTDFITQNAWPAYNLILSHELHGTNKRHSRRYKFKFQASYS